MHYSAFMTYSNIIDINMKTCDMNELSSNECVADTRHCVVNYNKVIVMVKIPWEKDECVTEHKGVLQYHYKSIVYYCCVLDAIVLYEDSIICG